MASTVPSYDDIQTTVTRFASGHGWTATGAGSTDLNFTSSPKFGTQCVSITTGGTGTATVLAKTGLGPYDLTHCGVSLWVRARDLTHLLLQVRVGTDSTNYYTVNILSALKVNEWTKIATDLRSVTTTGSPSRSNITYMAVRAFDNATGTATLDVNEFAFFPLDNTYPNGVVSLTFDDGYATQHDTAAVAMAAYDFPGTVYLIVDDIDTGGGAITSAQVASLRDTYGWEIGGHTFANHADWRTLTNSVLDVDMAALAAWLDDNSGSRNIAYPFGDYDARVESIARKYFSSARQVDDPTHLTLPPDNPMRLRSYNVAATTLPSAITTAVDQAIAEGTWLIIMFHSINTSPTGAEYDPTDFQTVIDYLHTTGVPVKTVDQVIRATVGYEPVSFAGQPNFGYAAPAFTTSPNLGIGKLDLVNTAMDGTGQMTTLFTAGSLGAEVSEVRVQATGNPADSLVNLFLFDAYGVPWYWQSVDLGDPAAASTTAAGYSTTLTTDLQLPAGWSLRASVTATPTAGAVNIFAIGADA